MRHVAWRVVLGSGAATGRLTKVPKQSPRPLAKIFALDLCSETYSGLEDIIRRNERDYGFVKLRLNTHSSEPTAGSVANDEMASDQDVDLSAWSQTGRRRCAFDVRRGLGLWSAALFFGTAPRRDTKAAGCDRGRCTGWAGRADVGRCRWILRLHQIEKHTARCGASFRPPDVLVGNDNPAIDQAHASCHGDFAQPSLRHARGSTMPVVTLCKSIIGSALALHAGRRLRCTRQP